jgi:hypothetical protein
MQRSHNIRQRLISTFIDEDLKKMAFSVLYHTLVICSRNLRQFFCGFDQVFNIVVRCGINKTFYHERFDKHSDIINFNNLL